MSDGHSGCRTRDALVRALRGETPGRLIDVDGALSVLRSMDLGVGICHPLGFIRFDLTHHVASQPLERFYLHVWQGDRRRDRIGSIHTHVFDMSSLVLNGELTNIEYTVDGIAGAATDPLQGEFRVDYARDGQLSLRRRVHLTRGIATTYGPGQIYRIASDIPHESEPRGPMVLSLIRKLFPECLDVGPLVYVEGDEVPGSATSRPGSMVDAASVLDKVIDQRG